MSAERPSRVAFVTDIVTPYMTAVFRALAERSRLSVIFSAERGSRGADWTIDAGETLDRTVVGGLVIRRGVDSTDYYPDPRLLTALARARPEGIVVGGFSFPTLYAASYGRFAGSAVAIHSDGTSESERHISRGQQLTRTVLLRAAHCAVANSAAAADRFRELGVREERLFRANHTTDMDAFWAVGHARTAADGPLRVISVGRLIPRKGLELLIEAVRRAGETGAQVRLDIVGSGPEQDRLRAVAAEHGVGERIVFHGFVDQHELPPLYADADVFAFPTLEDPFGIVALEAAACGLPILGSLYAGATTELVEEGVTGHRIDPRDVGALAGRLVQLAADRERTLEMGRAAHRETLSRTPAAAAEGYLAALAVARTERGSAVTAARA